MTSQNEDILRDGPTRLRDDGTPDVEGHIRKAHTIRVEEPIEGSREDGLEDDGPDVEGHSLRF
jgi:hypothetical protein